MEEVIHLRTKLKEKIQESTQTGERIYYEKKLGTLDVLLGTILRDAAPVQDELDFYILSYKLEELKKSENKKLIEEMTKKVDALRAKVTTTQHKRLF